jgi:hypothetical protein
MMLQRTISRPMARRAFDLLGFLEGRTLAHGIFEDRFGKLRRYFTVEMTGTMDGQVLTLEEDFVYSDGTTDRRVWILKKTGPESFSGTCEDTLTPATGHLGTERCEMSYKILLDIGSRQVAVRFDDVFYFIDDRTVVNRSTVTKLGVRLGQAIIVFAKPQLAPAEEQGSLGNRSASEIEVFV